jgi:hypothetical protein
MATVAATAAAMVVATVSANAAGEEIGRNLTVFSYRAVKMKYILPGWAFSLSCNNKSGINPDLLFIIKYE